MHDPAGNAYIIMLVLLAIGAVMALYLIWDRRKNPDWPMQRYIGADGKEYIWMPPNSRPLSWMIGWL